MWLLTPEAQQKSTVPMLSWLWGTDGGDTAKGGWRGWTKKESAVTQVNTNNEAATAESTGLAWVRGGSTGHWFPHFRVAPTKGWVYSKTELRVYFKLNWLWPSLPTVKVFQATIVLPLAPSAPPLSRASKAHSYPTVLSPFFHFTLFSFWLIIYIFFLISISFNPFFYCVLTAVFSSVLLNSFVF